MKGAGLFFTGTKVENVVAVNAHGAIKGMYRREQDGSFIPISKQQAGKKNRRCLIVIPPGTCAVRSLQLEGASDREMEQALSCLAKSSLLQPWEDGYVSIRCTRQGDLAMGVLFWCAKTILDNCVVAADESGFMVCGFLVPELLLGSKESCLLLYEDSNACQGMRLLCHAFPESVPIILCSTTDAPGKDLLFAAMRQEVRRQNLPDPVRILYWQKSVSAGDSVDAGSDCSTLPVPSCWEEATCQCLQGWPELLPFLLPPPAGSRKIRQLPFSQCLQRESPQPLEPRGYVKLALSLLLSLMLLAAFISTLYSQLENEVAQLEKEAAQISRASQQAAKATQLIRNLQKKNRIIRKLAQDKPYSLELLKIIAEATADNSRLESVAISRDGSVVINGLSKEAANATAIVKKLEESPKVIQCTLSALEHMADSNQYKFTIQVRSEFWASFFQKDEK